MVETPHFELVVPCFNEAESIELLINKSIQSALDCGLTPQTFQLVLVDNGSRDKTAEVLNELSEKSCGRWFRVVKLEVNQGYGGGIFEGLKTTCAPWVGFTHADLQCDPKDALQAFLDFKNLAPRAMIQGRRKSRELRDWLISRVFEMSVGIIWGFWSYDINAQPKVFTRDLLEKLKNPPRGIPFDAFVLLISKKNGFSQKRFDVVLAKRPYGKSHWNFSFRKRFETFLKVVQDLWKVRIITQSQ